MNLGYIDVNQKREFWKELSEKISGEFKIKHHSSSSHESLHLNFKFNGIEVEFIETDTQPLKVKFSHQAKMKIEISVTVEDFIDKAIKIFGGNKEIQIGDPIYDDYYLIKGNDNYILKKFLIREIRDLMLEMKVYSLNCSTNKKTEKIDFTYTINRQINDFNGLYDVYQLICKTINQFKDLRII